MEDEELIERVTGAIRDSVASQDGEAIDFRQLAVEALNALREWDMERADSDAAASHEEYMARKASLES